MNIKDLRVKDFIENRDIAVSSDDGDLLFRKIDDLIKEKTIVELNFEGISLMTTAFLNSAIGQLYSKYTSEQLNTHLKLKNVAEDDRILFKKVIERAKEYFKNKKGFEDSADKAMYDS